MINSITVHLNKNFEQMLQYAANAGFKDVLLGFGSGNIFDDDDYEKNIEKLQVLFNRFGLTCGQTHLPSYHLTVSSEIKDEQTETRIRRAIKASAALGAKWTTYHPRTDIKNGYNRTKSFEANAEILKGYLEDAEKCDIGIAVENMPLYPHERPDWRFFGSGWEELCELCDTLNSDKLGICWDFGHAHTAALKQYIAIPEIGSRLKMTHVHDNYRRGDQHQLPGLGSLEWDCVNWPKVIQALKASGYQGSLALEVLYPPLSMCESFMKLAYDSLEYLKSL